MSYGFAGRILHVDLTRGALTIETPPASFYRQYLGGSAMGLYYILKHAPNAVDAFAPENVLTLMVGPFTGAPIAGQSRMTANAWSPLTDGIGDSQSGGYFPAEMKFAGFDGVVVTGQSPEPVYLWIKDGRAELCPAAHLWGKTTSQVDDILKEELGDKHIQVAQCGPAGENLARVACIINMANRANGRTGMGAVMGAKKLKAVVVRGSSKHVNIAHPDQFNRLARWGVTNIPNNSSMLSLHRDGTAGGLSSQHSVGGLPTRNFGEGQFEDNEAIDGATMTETILKQTDSCYACAVRCKRAVETEWDGHRVAKRHGGPEYETMATLGSYCGIGDLDAIAYGNQLCNEYGLDTIGAGATIAWLMECFENKLVTEKEIGFPARYGDAHALIQLLEMMTRREGIGDVLANGSRRAADLLGRGHEFLITVKGAEAPAHMPHVKRSLGLIYAVNPYGADHESSEHDPSIASNDHKDRLGLFGFTQPMEVAYLGPEKVRYAYTTQLFYSFLDSASLCTFVYSAAWTLFGPADAVALVCAVTGWDDFSLDELLQVGARRLNMMRVSNVRRGVDRRADVLPQKFFKPLAGTGPSAGVALSHAEMDHALDEYYALAGWNAQTGAPETETLDKLGLEWLV
ncbi:MAG: aldehyde ferredoxin oxidoreductase family protein [Chloroflexi bacterium]|nr:aldehyde ferredoxin oxidoreductase family protein [Chloroflexota bacterium]